MKPEVPRAICNDRTMKRVRTRGGISSLGFQNIELVGVSIFTVVSLKVNKPLALDDMYLR